ncbi:hypothetical protein GNF10_04660 [Nostoc sp. UCD121]|uniref:K(+)-transporting ATPase subunit F n=1 Tax=unclassified Nostoc TaxID=2593658 RepID=UPI001629A9C6
MNKQVDVWEKLLSLNLIQAMFFVWSELRQQHSPLAIFILLCLNVVIAPDIYAVSSSIFEQRSN